ncbi:TolA-binding protein [Natronospira proteinivora]|uniref:TolA-binding protein n=1 Tax=Natronospira proteinivora TaxID=1807133 RepID=A0ABT1GDP9_9GAMM|nr:DUF4168 domain-containing protein [Natronospira proteinivora]MCP1728378.1 TolA-binding protein [Natronospira proteinivora]
MTRASLMLLALILLFGAHAALAQEPPETDPETSPSAQQRDDDDEEEAFFGDLEQSKVDSFAEVHPRIRELEQDFVRRLRDREEGQDTREMQRELSEERLEMIEDAGLTSEEYRQILEGMAQSEDLREYIEDQYPEDFEN